MMNSNLSDHINKMKVDLFLIIKRVFSSINFKVFSYEIFIFRKLDGQAFQTAIVTYRKSV